MFFFRTLDLVLFLFVAGQSDLKQQSFSQFPLSFIMEKEAEVVSLFRQYLKIKTVQPEPDYGILKANENKESILK